jgi:hypothetical protein
MDRNAGKAFFQAQGKHVLTFVGYSAAGYDDPARLRAPVKKILEEFDPAHTLVNSGATSEGIGVVYALARAKGFTTTGIGSAQAQEAEVAVSPHVAHVFYLPDERWGGFQEDRDELSPTSAALVENSDTLIGIGGGGVARDELRAAQRGGKKIRFIPADLDHAKASHEAQAAALPPPSDFAGEAHRVFGDQASDPLESP